MWRSMFWRAHWIFERAFQISQGVYQVFIVFPDPAVARVEGVEQQTAASIVESAKGRIEIVRRHRGVASSRGR